MENVFQRSKIGYYFSKMKGNGKSPLKISAKPIGMGMLGGFTAIGVLAWLTTLTSTPWLMAPFGASCVLAFGIWDAPFSQPRNMIGGHLVSTFIGLLSFHLLGNHIWVLALSVGLAIGCMMLTKTTHPPAGADPIVVISGAYGWGFLFSPVLIGAILITIIALLFNNLDKKRNYPTFWY